MSRSTPMKVVHVTTMHKALHRAAGHTGGWAALARALTANGDPISRQGVFSWQSRGIPAERALQIEKVTRGVVQRHELRPDIFEGYTRQGSA